MKIIIAPFFGGYDRKDFTKSAIELLNSYVQKGFISQDDMDTFTAVNGKLYHDEHGHKNEYKKYLKKHFQLRNNKYIIKVVELMMKNDKNCKLKVLNVPSGKKYCILVEEEEYNGREKLVESHYEYICENNKTIREYRDEMFVI